MQDPTALGSEQDRFTQIRADRDTEGVGPNALASRLRTYGTTFVDNYKTFLQS